ncbi:hypothetical protein ULMA_30850 [Patiriisocius marinus]|uniref:AsmA domain-containing protein n=1 Tax=Patiriisocius marinus TaxID=1397112 RepID=A0A5J4J8Y6_9FLAO|nr:AsmA-like C-terminal region-containing protein [Patiriisocius marinus]GER60977.1 hypothetical protein ULMA_30850 [Patiriisocius marinus]
MKKVLKISGIVLGVIILFLLAAPYLFKGSLEKLLVKNINKNINATVAWENFDLSLVRSFPNATLVVENFSVINKEPFAGDTLASGEQLKLHMGITPLFKSGDNPIKLDEIILNNTYINILVNENGVANYDITKKNNSGAAEQTSQNESSGFTFDLQHYELKNSRVNYIDESTKTYLSLKELNHEGTGDFSLDNLELDTYTSAIVSYKMDKLAYLSNNKVALDAVFQMDLTNQKYTFLENEAKVNELPLKFDGFVKVNENSNEIDLTFNTPSSDFKNFLAVIPKEYVKELDGVTTTGNFTVNGVLKGIVDEEHIPTMNIKVRSENASFKYPNLPKTVRDISINADLVNSTGLLKDTYLNIAGMTFKIDEELFNLSGNIKDFTNNMLINLALKGTINLANIEKVLPVELDKKLTGIFKADVITNFDMKSVETEQYQNIKTNGTASIKDFTYQDAAFKNPINIDNAAITMSPGNIQLDNMTARSGSTDMNATGSIQNLIPWVMAKQDLKGRFKVTSNTFNVNDFMTTETPATGKSSNNTSFNEEASFKLPDFLDATLDFNVNKVLYDDLVLENTKGSVSIKDETAALKNVTSTIFGGDIAIDGNVNTKQTTPTFGMDLDLSKINIEESFSKLGLLKFLAPVAKALQGSMTTKFKLNGNLNQDLTPNLKTLAGTAFAEILTAEVDKNQMPLLSQLSQQLTFIDLDKLSLRDVTTNLTFNDGNIIVAPFNFDVKGIKVTAGGSHGLDQQMNYNVKLDVPARYLGSEVTSLLSKINPAEANAMTVALPIGLTGNFTNPKINLNTKAAISELTQKLIDKQKDELIDKGTNAIKDIITGGGNSSGNNTTGGTVGGILNGILKPKDSTTTNQTTTPPKEDPQTVIKDVLGGIFGNKNKAKDSIEKGN